MANLELKIVVFQKHSHQSIHQWCYFDRIHGQYQVALLVNGINGYNWSFYLNAYIYD